MNVKLERHDEWANWLKLSSISRTAVSVNIIKVPCELHAADFISW